MLKIIMYVFLFFLRIYFVVFLGKYCDVDMEKVVIKLGIWRGSFCLRMGVIFCVEVC